MKDLFAVVEHNQASHQPVENHVWIRADEEEAWALAEDLRAQSRAVGRREGYFVYRMEPLEEYED